MKRYIIHRKKKKTNECDGCGGGDCCAAAPFDAAPPGIGNAVPGGADRWDNIFAPMQTQSKSVSSKKKKRKFIHRKKHG